MKTIAYSLLALMGMMIVLVLTGCVTTTRPDGSVSKSTDIGALSLGLDFARDILTKPPVATPIPEK